MALINCSGCGVRVSSRAKSCPQCGEPIKKKTSGCAWVAAFLLAVAGISMMLSDDRNTVAEAVTPAQLVNSPLIQQDKPNWLYETRKDEMSGKDYSVAQVVSENTVNFDFPYSGAQHGELILRDHPRYGKDIIFKIGKGQILCKANYDDDCSILVRFGEGKAVSYQASEASDSSNNVLFISNHSKFISEMKGVDEVRLSVSIYQEGNPVFTFDVRGFDLGKYDQTYKPDKDSIYNRVKDQFNSNAEKSAVTSMWVRSDPDSTLSENQNKIFMVAVFDDGKDWNDYLNYVCKQIEGGGISLKGVSVSIIDGDKLADKPNNYVSLAHAACL